MTSKRGLARLFICSVILTGSGAATLAQTPAPREVPQGFVLPGPAPKNAGAGVAAPAMATPVPAPAMATPVPAPATPPDGEALPMRGTMATAPQFVLPQAGTTQLLGVGSTSGDVPGAHEWPCVQRRVDQVAAGQVWQGPPLDGVSEVARTQAMRQLVETVKTRRVPLAEAEKTAADFVKALPAQERSTVATAIFSDLLADMNKERSDIMRGIERYGAKQQKLAEKIRRENAAISDLRAKADADPARVQEAQETILWDTRIFGERRGSLSYVCEVPQLIEQRLFALGRAIGRSL